MFKVGDRARIVGALTVAGKECTVIGVGPYEFLGDVSEYLISIDGRPDAPAAFGVPRGWLILGRNLEPIRKQENGSWEEIEELCEWNPTKKPLSVH